MLSTCFTAHFYLCTSLLIHLRNGDHDTTFQLQVAPQVEMHNNNWSSWISKVRGLPSCATPQHTAQQSCMRSSAHYIGEVGFLGCPMTTFCCLTAVVDSFNARARILTPVRQPLGALQQVCLSRCGIQRQNCGNCARYLNMCYISFLSTKHRPGF